MKIWLGQHRTPDFPQGSAVTIGNFDGVPLGHKHILQKLKQEADAPVSYTHLTLPTTPYV